MSKQQHYRYFNVSGEPDDDEDEEPKDQDYTCPDVEIRPTDSGNARRLIKRHGHNLRYVAQWNGWLVWNGHYWERDLTGEVMRLAQDTVRSIYAEAAQASDRDRKIIARWAMQSESKERIKSMVTLASFQKEVALTANDFDAQPWLLNCKNVTIDLRTGKSKKQDRKDLLTNALDFDYDPSATCPLFVGFLDKIMAGNKTLIAFLQRAIGYSLTADISEECIFVPEGKGSNGKSTLLNMIRRGTGSYARSMSPDTLAASNKRNGSGPSSDIARLKGARFISCIETDEGQKLDESRIKQFTSNEPIVARGMHENDVEFPPTWKLWLATNHKPVIRGTDDGIWRRIKRIPFNVTLRDGEKDPHFLDKLYEELPGFLNWAIEGCLAWQREGLGEPDEVKAATNEYRTEMDVLGKFIAECCVQDPNTRVKLADLWRQYDQWAQGSGETRITNTILSDRMRERGFTVKRGSKGATVCIGIRLKTAWEMDQDASPEGEDASPFASPTPEDENEETLKYSGFVDLGVAA